MSNKNKVFGIFIIVALVQLFVPLKMIYDNESVLKNGIPYKFKTEPIDPRDPFRGNYVYLDYAETVINIKNAKKWQERSKAYAALTVDKDGFAKIKSISNRKYKNGEDFIEIKIGYSITEGKLSIVLPFDRFYMEETKAPKAEVKFIESGRDEKQLTYALVRVENGTAVVEDVFINDVPLVDLVTE